MEAALKLEHFTYSDYLTWDDDDERCELIYGKVYYMASPLIRHQAVQAELVTQLNNFL